MEIHTLSDAIIYIYYKIFFSKQNLPDQSERGQNKDLTNLYLNFEYLRT